MDKRIKIGTLIFSVFVFLVIGALLIFSNQTKANNGEQKQIVPQKNERNSMIDLKIIAPPPHYGIEAIEQSDPQFNLILSQQTLDSNSVRLSESVRPFALMIKNKTPNDIVAISLRWILTNQKGEETIIPQSVVNPGVLMGIKSIPIEKIKQNNLIHSGKYQFFSLIDSEVGMVLNSINTGNAVSINPDQIVQIEQSSIEKRNQFLSKISAIAVSIDGIAFSNGAFVGRDENLFFDYLNGFLQARKDILVKARKLKSDGKNDSAILAQVLSESEVISNGIELRQNPRNKKESFEKSYKENTRIRFVELRNRRGHISDKKIIEDLLNEDESKIILLRNVD